MHDLQVETPPEAGDAAPAVPLGHARGAAFDGVFRAALRHYFADAPLLFVLADGTPLLVPESPPVATIELRDRATLARLLLDPEDQFGDAFAVGAIEVRGDLVAALGHAYRSVSQARAFTLPPLPLGHSFEAARENVHRHYDLGNEFYRLWLDEQLVYTCAYYESPALSLEEAQVAKMDHVCRKLRLRPGERVIEAGCGWGALALHMARRYGARVEAYNVSREQVAYARERAAREGLAGRVEFLERDYREIEGRCDAFVSVGMLEHVGRENYRTLGAVIDSCLEPGRGRGLIHFIGRNHASPLNAWIRRRIFPGAYTPTLGEALRGVLEPAGLSVTDVENLRLHYARTLAHWHERFEAAWSRVAAELGEPFARAWRLYLAGSEAAFRTGSLQLFQVAFARGETNDLPWTRAHLHPMR